MTEAADREGRRFELRPWRCPICLVNDERLIGLRGGKYHRYRLGITSRIVQCRRCALLYPNPFPVPLDPQQLYGDPVAYFQRHDEEKKVSASRTLLREFAAHVGRPSFRILDIGSGKGELLEAARLEGIEAVGLEFSDAMIKHAQTRYGISMLPKPVEQYALESKLKFDAFSMNAVLEHVYDPNAMIEAVARLAAPGAVAYIDVPNEPNFLTRVGNLAHCLTLRPSVFNLSPSWSPYHVYGFNPKAIGILLSKHGFKVIEQKIFAEPHIPSRPELKDRIRSFAGAQAIRLGNALGMGSNMVVWARREP